MRRRTRWVGVTTALVLIVGLSGVAELAGASASAHARAARRLASPASAHDRAPGPPATATATATSVPTLGLHQKFTEGFGHIRPRGVSYGGDPTSMVGDVHWSSWGGAHAVGHGVAEWTWPGWCVACGSIRLPATVVAFGLRTCGGHPAYAHVEWYFPSRGMSFSPRLGTPNICNLRASSGAGGPPLVHCARVRAPGQLITKVEVVGYGVQCPAARTFLAKLDPVSHYRHNARFQVGAWWCGSELQMQTSRTGPQSFACEFGDYNDVSFDVMPTADVTGG